MTIQNKNVPALRFPEFSEDWKENNLGNVATFTKGKGISKIDVVENGEFECVRYGELYTHYGEIINKVRSKTNLSRKELVFSEANDVIIPSSGETQIDIATASCVLKSGIALGGDLNILKTRMNGVFLSYYLNNKKRLEIASLAQGISVVHLYASQLKLLSLNLPTLPEQLKIATFFTAIDEKIQQLIKKKDLLEQYKKGVMQKIFSQEIRFKDDNGNNFPDWKQQRLSNFLTERNEKTPKSDQYPLMAFVAHIGVTHKGERYNREFLVNDSDGKDYKRTEYGDFIYSSNNLETGSIGLNRYGAASISPVYGIFKIKDSCDYDFVGNYLTRKSFINKMIKYRQGVVYGQWRIHESDFLNIVEEIPVIQEQKKIATFLSAIDCKISLVTQELNKTKEYKKGLLQQMFV